MNILFNFEFDQSITPPPKNVMIIFEESKKFIRERFRPLEEEIDLIQVGSENATIVVTLEEDGFLFGFINIPKRLQTKLLSAVTTDDLDYLLQSIERKIRENYRGNTGVTDGSKDDI